MRVALVARKRGPVDLWDWSRKLSQVLSNVEVEWMDASEWIPDSTEKHDDRAATSELAKRTQGFDLVHAFGYRTAWACGSAFKGKRPWIATLWDVPKTTHPDLIDRLGHARRLLCASANVRHSLFEAGLERLLIAPPGIETEDLDRVETPPESTTFGVIVRGYGDREHLKPIVRGWERIKHRVPEARMIVYGEIDSDLLPDGSVSVTESWEQVPCSILVFPDPNEPIRFDAMRAMHAGIPLLAGDSGGLTDLVIDRENGFTYSGTESLPDVLAGILQMPLMLGAAGSAARARIEDHFGLEGSLSVVSRAYDR